MHPVATIYSTEKKSQISLTGATSRGAGLGAVSGRREAVVQGKRGRRACGGGGAAQGFIGEAEAMDGGVPSEVGSGGDDGGHEDGEEREGR
jgi:hypothetical protein